MVIIREIYLNMFIRSNEVDRGKLDRKQQNLWFSTASLTETKKRGVLLLNSHIVEKDNLNKTIFEWGDEQLKY